MYKNNETQEIDLLFILYRALLRWKVLLGAMLLFAILAGVTKYGIDMVSYEKEQRNQDKVEQLSEEQLSEESISEENLSEGLTESEVQKVKLLCQRKKMLDNLYHYRDNAPMMKLDATNIRKVRYIYRIMGATDDNVVAASQYYMNLFAAQDYYNKLSNTVYKGYDAEYLSEVCTVVYSPYSYRDGQGGTSDAGVITITYSLPDNADDSKIEDVLKETISVSENKTLQGCSLQLLGEPNEFYIVDRNILQSQNSTLSDIANLENIINTTMEGFSKQQTSLYNFLIGEKQNDSAQTEEQNDSAQTEQLIRPTFDVTYVIIGAVIGIVVVFAIQFFELMFSKKVSYCNDVAREYRLNQLFEIHSFKPETSWQKLNFGTKIYARKYKDVPAASLQYDNAATYVEDMHGDNAEIQFVSVDSFSDAMEKHIAELEKRMVEKGLHVTKKQIVFVGKLSILNQIDTDKQLIICVQERVTDKAKLNYLMEACKEAGANVLGMVYVDC